MLSERKEEVRRVGVFEEVNLKLLYQTEVGVQHMLLQKFVARFNLTPQQLELQFADKSLPGRIFALLQ